MLRRGREGGEEAEDENVGAWEHVMVLTMARGREFPDGNGNGSASPLPLSFAR